MGSNRIAQPPGSRASKRTAKTENLPTADATTRRLAEASELQTGAKAAPPPARNRRVSQATARDGLANVAGRSVQTDVVAGDPWHC